MDFKVGIRTKTLLSSLLLLAIPWVGYQYINDMEKFLRAGQEETLVAISRAVASALHDREDLFNHSENFMEQLSQSKNLFARVIDNPIQLDGSLDDWNDLYDSALEYTAENDIVDNTGPEFGFKHNLAIHNRYLYAFFEVTDDNVIYRSKDSKSIIKNDYLQIAYQNENNDIDNFIISPNYNGWVTSYRINPKTFEPIEPDNRIHGTWKETQSGYVLEIRIPRNNINKKLGFALANSIQSGTEYKQLISTSELTSIDDLGLLVSTSPEIENILRGLKRAKNRIWVVDSNGIVVARSGKLRQPSLGQFTQENSDFFDSIRRLWIDFLYFFLFREPTEDFSDSKQNSHQINTKALTNAISGQTGLEWKLTDDNKAIIISAASPIYSRERILGAVLVEETTNNILSLRNEALIKLLTAMLFVFITSGLVLFIFTTHLSKRITMLALQTDKAVSNNGSVIGSITIDNTRDEIGELSRKISLNLNNQKSYNEYLQNMARRLSHEIRTPLALIRSSIDNIAQSDTSNSDIKYIERAQTGINRLNGILTRISEATALEQSIDNVVLTDINLRKIIANCLDYYREMYILDVVFICDVDACIKGNDELIFQMIDKIMLNAIDFHEKNSTITVSLIKENNYYLFSVTNTGVLLPDNMNERIFDSMVSIRNDQSNKDAHLGLGLYIVNLIAKKHGGSARAENLDKGDGAVIKIRIPTNID